MSDIATKVAYSTIYQTVGKSISLILGLVQVYLLLNYLGLAGFGQYQTVLAFFGIAVVMAEFGLHITNVTNLSKPGADQSKILSNAFTLRFLASTIIFIIAILVGYFVLPFDDVVRTGIVVTSIAFFALSINQVFVGVFQKNFANHMLVLGEIVSKAIIIVAIVILSRMNAGVLAVLASLNIAWLIHLSMTMFFAYRYIPFSFDFDFALWKKLLSESWPIAISVILNLVYFRTDTIILSIYKGPVDVGIYNVPYKMIEVLLAFPLLFTGLLLPLMAQSVEAEDYAGFKKILQNGFNALVYGVTLIALVSLLFAEPIIAVFSSERIEESANVLRLLMIAIVFLFIGTLFGHAIPALNLQKKMIFGYLLGAIAGLSTYFLLIPEMSYYGAAIGTILAEFLAAVFAATLVWRKIKSFVSIVNALKAVLIALSLGALWTLTPLGQELPWFISAILISLIYSGGLYLTGAITRDDIKILKPQRIRQ